MIITNKQISRFIVHELDSVGALNCNQPEDAYAILEEILDKIDDGDWDPADYEEEVESDE